MPSLSDADDLDYIRAGIISLRHLAANGRFTPKSKDRPLCPMWHEAHDGHNFHKTIFEEDNLFYNICRTCHRVVIVEPGAIDPASYVDQYYEAPRWLT